MEFVPISIDKFVTLHLRRNPNWNKSELERSLKLALNDYKSGIKCGCGNDIWVIGSAFTGRGCFTCITGESDPSGDYEIRGADIKTIGVSGFFNDVDDGFDEENDSEIPF